MSLSVSAADDEEIDFSNEVVAPNSDSSFDEDSEFDDEFTDTEIKDEAKAEEAPTKEVPTEEASTEEAPKVEELEVAQPQQPEPEPDPQPQLEPEPEPEPEPELAQTPMQDQDDPNLEYETQLHDIYTKFHSAKTPTEEWDTILKYRNSEQYKISPGDNLWTISKTIFGDGGYWPKVWSLNSKIQNPHLISPQNTIRFLLGDEFSPPAFTVTENTAESSAVTQKPIVPQASVVDDSASEESGPEIPPPSRTSRAVVRQLPPSFPIWQEVGSQGNFDKLGVDYGHRKILDIEDSIPLPSYISETPLRAYGRVSEIEIGANLASSYQYIYVAMKKGYAHVGDTFLAVADRGEVQSVHSTINGFLGYTIDVLGEVQLVEKVALKKEAENEEMFRALVLKIINPVSVGASLITGKIEKIKITDQGPQSRVVAQIIGGSYFNRRQVYGDESIAYLNKGSVHGLEVGQILPIRASRTVRNENSKIESSVTPIGWLRIVQVTPHFATTVVVKAWSDILTGDLTGAGMVGSKMSSTKNFDHGESSEGNGKDAKSIKTLEEELDSE